HAHLGVGCHRRGADSIRIELHELPEPSRTWLFVAEHPAETIRAVWQCQILEILGDVARQRRRKVIAQREPLLVIVLEREHAFVGSVLIGQELAEGVGIFDGRRLHRLKAVSLEDDPNCLDHLAGCGDLGRPAIREAARQARFELLGLAGLIGHLPVYISDGGITATLETAAGGLVPALHLFMLRMRRTRPRGTAQRVAVMATAQAQAKIAIPNDLEPYWMPFTANRAFKKRPKMIVGAKDMHYIASDGRKLLDGAAGLWCTNAGHNREPIVEAIQREAATLDYAPAFQFSHPKAFELASRIAALAPADLDHVFFCNSGSEAVDTALKIALAFHNVRGNASRVRLIGRERGYHGVGFGGIAVGGIVNNRKQFGALFAGVDHLITTYNREKQAFSIGEPEWGAHLADDLDRLVGL